MKIKKSQLKKVIQEELSAVLGEAAPTSPSVPFSTEKAKAVPIGGYKTPGKLSDEAQEWFDSGAIFTDEWYGNQVGDAGPSYTWTDDQGDQHSVPWEEWYNDPRHKQSSRYGSEWSNDPIYTADSDAKFGSATGEGGGLPDINIPTPEPREGPITKPKKSFKNVHSTPGVSEALRQIVREELYGAIGGLSNQPKAKRPPTSGRDQFDTSAAKFEPDSDSPLNPVSSRGGAFLPGVYGYDYHGNGIYTPPIIEPPNTDSTPSATGEGGGLPDIELGPKEGPVTQGPKKKVTPNKLGPNARLEEQLKQIIIQELAVVLLEKEDPIEPAEIPNYIAGLKSQAAGSETSAGIAMSTLQAIVGMAAKNPQLAAAAAMASQALESIPKEAETAARDAMKA